MTALAVPIMVHSVERALADAARAAEFGADLVEYRLDRVADDPSAATAIVEASPLPCIVTCRPVWEGGEFEGPDGQRVELFRAACAGARRPAYLDVELAAFRRSAELRRVLAELVDRPDGGSQRDTGLILSAHDFTTRPADLLQRVAAMADEPLCRVIKVAWRARSLRDNLEAFELLGQAYKPTIALCMGEFGLASRVLAGKFHALLTFASLDEQAATAPGQPTLTELKTLYRWDRLDAQTRVYGVVGYPVGHSMSPPIHNAGFDAAGVNAVYLPMPIPPEYEHFKATMTAWLEAPTLGFRGASVTIPHKEHLLRFVRERGGRIEPLAERIGAANTLTVGEDGGLEASNTDYAAALDAVCEALSIGREQLAGRRVAVLGAGGAARAVVAGFAACGATVVIYNRTLERAKRLAKEFTEGPGKVVAASWDKLCDTCCEVFINCTPLGMYPNVDQTPMPSEGEGAFRGVGPGVVAFDTIYNPMETRWLREARAAGCVTIPGTAMFVLQAAGQFERWTGRDAPIEIFERALRERLSRGPSA